MLLTCDLGEMALSKAWTDLMAEERDITLLAYTALQLEARRPGTVPQELLSSLAAKVSPDMLTAQCIARLENDAIEYIREVEALLKQDNELAQLIAYYRVSELVDGENINLHTIEAARCAIADDVHRFESLLISGTSRHINQTQGGMAA